MHPFCLPAEMLLLGGRLALLLVAGLCVGRAGTRIFLVNLVWTSLSKLIRFRWLPPSTCEILAYKVPELFLQCQKFFQINFAFFSFYLLSRHQ